MIRAFVAGLVLALLPVTALSAQNWNATFTTTARGHMVGNPDAKTKLIAFVSYSCPHCREFEYQADGPLQLQYIRSGKVSFEVRPVLRNPVDLAAALIVQCGPADKFWGNFRAMYHAQEKWLPILDNEDTAQTNRYITGTLGARNRAIASDLGFYRIMAPRGYGIAQINQCLSDEAAATKLVENARADAKQFDIPGTPSFAIDGKPLPGIYSWAALKPILDATVQAQGTSQKDS